MIKLRNYDSLFTKLSSQCCTERLKLAPPPLHLKYWLYYTNSSVRIIQYNEIYWEYFVLSRCLIITPAVKPSLSQCLMVSYSSLFSVFGCTSLPTRGDNHLMTFISTDAPLLKLPKYFAPLI